MIGLFYSWPLFSFGSFFLCVLSIRVMSCATCWIFCSPSLILTSHALDVWRIGFFSAEQIFCGLPGWKYTQSMHAQVISLPVSSMYCSWSPALTFSCIPMSLRLRTVPPGGHPGERNHYVLRCCGYCLWHIRYAYVRSPGLEPVLRHMTCCSSKLNYLRICSSFSGA